MLFTGEATFLKRKDSPEKEDVFQLLSQAEKKTSYQRRRLFEGTYLSERNNTFLKEERTFLLEEDDLNFVSVLSFLATVVFPFLLLSFIKIPESTAAYMLLLSSISSKDVLFIFSTNKAAAEEVTSGTESCEGCL